MEPRNAPTYPVDVKSQTVTSTVDKPAEMREAKKLKSLATAVTRRVPSLPERQREAGKSRIRNSRTTRRNHEYPKDISNELGGLGPNCGIAGAAGEDGL